MKFSPLDYSSPPSDGFYWVAGTRPVADPDDCSDGVVRSGYTGETEKFVALVWLSVGEDNCIEYHAVDRDNMGTVHEEDSVTHYAPFMKPAHPEAVPA